MFLVNEKIALASGYKEMFESLEKVFGSWTLRCNAYYKVNYFKFISLINNYYNQNKIFRKMKNILSNI